MIRLVLILGTVGIVLLPHDGSPAPGNQPAGGRSAGMANASVALFDPWGVFNNQAGMAFIEGITMGFYAENRYLLKELGFQAGYFLFPVKPGTIGISLRRFGFSAYSENTVGLAYARGFGQRLAIGLQLDYIAIRSQETDYGSDLVTFETGLIIRISPDLLLAVHLYNPVTFMVKKPASINHNNTLMRIGMAYTISGKILLSGQVQKDLVTPVRFMAGFEYALTSSICFRSGIATQPTQLSFGTGYHWKKIHLDFSASIHQQLGWYPQLSIHFAP